MAASCRLSLALLVSAQLAAAACAGQDSVWLHPDEPSDPAERCGTAASGASALGKTRAALSVVDRSLIGEPAAYRADASLSERALALMGSQRLRRQVAWQLAERVLAEVPLSLLPDLGQVPSARLQPSSLPAWQTWHAKDDLTRIFRRAYPTLSAEQRAARAPLLASALDEAWSWNDGAVNDFPEWTLERWNTYRDAIEDATEVAGLGGIYRVAYSPGASRQLLQSYAQILSCRSAKTPELATAEARTPSPPVAAGCGLPPSPPPDCLVTAFPADAAILKASWRRAEIGLPLPVYDTSAAGLQRRLADDGKLSWSEPDGEADPGPDQIYTLRLPNGNAFRLAALHIMTKELDHWFWTTLWWSPEPDGDFGADRPATLQGPWQHYKSCSVVAFDESDPDPRGGFGDDHPTLADALEASYAGFGGRTWCSNPYIEEGDGNAASNCIGCHQHAGTGLRSETILEDGEVFPDQSRRLVREDFPSDYVFAVSVGDDVGAMFQETEQHYAQ